MSTSSISAGSSRSHNESLTIPSGTSSGTYVVYITLDRYGDVDQSDESNDYAESSFTVTSPVQLPDLIVSALSVSPTSGAAGSSATVSVTVKNNGPGSAPSGTVCRIRLASSTTISGTDPLLGEFTVGSLAANGTQSFTRTVTIPSGTAAGSRYIGATANATNTVTGETDVTNNQRTTPFTVTTPVQLPDLIVSALSVSPTSGAAGSSATVSVTVKNNGPGSAPSGTVCRIRLASSTTILGTDPLLDEFTVGSLAANGTQSFTRTVTIPSGTAAGSRYIGATANATNTVTGETDVTNNQRTTPFTVTTPTTYVITPPAATVGEGAGSVMFTITRSGGLPAETIYTSTTINEGYSNSGDYASINSQAVAFTANLTQKTISVPITNDSVKEPEERFGFIVQRNSSDLPSTYLARATFTIIDDDASSPKITKITPATLVGLTTDQPLLIEGSGFLDAPSAPTLEIDSPLDKGMVSKAAKLTFESASKIHYQINTGGDDGPWRLRVKNFDGGLSNWFSFTVTEPQSTVPAAPSNLVGMLSTGGAVSLAWSDNSNNESGFRVQRRTGSSSTWVDVATVGVNIAACFDSSVSPGNDYTYRVLAFNSAGNSPASNSFPIPFPSSGAVSVLVTAPSGGAAWSAGDSRQISWTTSGSVNLISYFRVFFSLNGGANYSEIAFATADPGNTRTWNIPSNFESSQARIKVTAYNSQGQEIVSNATSNFSLQIPVLRPVAIPDGNITPFPGETATFRGANSTAPAGRTITAYQWTMGDGTPKSGATITHSYASPGLYTATLTVTDSAGQTNSCPLSITVNGRSLGTENEAAKFADPVNLANGNFYTSADDISLPGMGFPVKFSRFYNSKAVDTSGRPLGYHWTHSYNLILTEAEGGVSISFGDGRMENHTLLPDGRYLAEPGVFDRLTKAADGKFRLTTKDQLAYLFDGGRLLSITDRNGNAQNLEYDGSGRLVKVSDSSGRFLAFTHNSDGRIQTITDPLGRTIQFGYDSAGNLVTVTGARGGVNRYSYDSLHQLLTATDPKGNVYVTNQYDDLQRVVSVQKDAYGAQTSFSYDFITRLTTVTDPFGNRTAHQHDDRLRLVAQTNELGHTESYAYDEANNRTVIVDRNGNATRYSYDAMGNVISKTDALQNRTFITYNANNDPLRRVDAMGNTVTFAYDSKGNLIRTTDPLGKSTVIAVNAAGKATSITDRNGNVTRHSYDAAGNLISTLDPAGGTTAMTYDAAGRVLTTTNPRGHTSVLTHDPNNNLLSSANPLGETVRHAYDANDKLARTTDPNGNETSFEYDAKDRLVKVTDAAGGVIRHEYDAYDRKTKTIDARGKATLFAYDGAGQLVSITNPLGQRTEFSYDAAGNRIAVTDALGRATTSAYDKLNRLVAITDPLGQSARIEYDALGRKVRTVDALGRATTFVYDKAGRLVRVTDPMGGMVSHSYDGEGNRLSTTNPKKQTTKNTYDRLGRVIKRVEPAGRTELFSYDPAGNLVRKVDAMKKVAVYEYDSANRLVRASHQDGTSVAFTYDKNGNRTGMVDAVGNSTFEYDNLNRLTRHVDPFAQTVTHSYDPNGNRVTLGYPGNRTVTYTYDDANRMTSVRDWGNRTTSYTYNAAGHLLETTNPNGTKEVRSYDTGGRLETLANSGPASETISNYKFFYDPVGNHRKVDSTEPLDQSVTAGSHFTYTFDAENRLTKRAYVPLKGEDPRLGPWNTTTFQYDANGNLLKALGPNRFDCSYDCENRLNYFGGGAEWGGALRSGQALVFEYDGAGNRVEIWNGFTDRQERGEDSLGSARFCLDIGSQLTNVIAITDHTYALSEFYVYGLGLVSKIYKDGTAEYYHYDSRGSTIAVTDQNGAIVRAFSYDPFGRVMDRYPTSTTLERFTFLGRHGVIDDEFALYVRARYYSRELGRFLTKDPFLGHFDQSQTLNRYVYSLNNPVLLVDISGFCAVRIENSTNGGSSNSNLFAEWLLESFGGDIAYKLPLLAAPFRSQTASLRNFITMQKATAIANDAITLAKATLDSGMYLNSVIQDSPTIRTTDAFALLAGELAAMPVNVVTGVGRGLGDVLIRMGSGGDRAFEESIRSDELYRIASHRVSGQDVANVANAYVGTVRRLENAGSQAISRTVNFSVDWIGTQLYNSGLY